MCADLGSDCCQLGDIFGNAAALSAESDQGGMTHSKTSVKDHISSLQAALVPAFHPEEQGPFAPFYIAAKQVLTAQSFKMLPFLDVSLTANVLFCTCDTRHHVPLQWQKVQQETQRGWM